MHGDKANWKNYLWQSFLAALAMCIILTIFSMQRALVVTSLAATTFIVFAKPRSPFAAPRSVIGGHLIGLLTGIAFAFIPQPSSTAGIVLSALAVGCSLLAMALLDAEHPPAAGTALTVVAASFSWKLVLAVAASAIVMALLHHLLQPYLRDL